MIDHMLFLFSLFFSTVHFAFLMTKDEKKICYLCIDKNEFKKKKLNEREREEKKFNVQHEEKKLLVYVYVCFDHCLLDLVFT